MLKTKFSAFASIKLLYFFDDIKKFYVTVSVNYMNKTFEKDPLFCPNGCGRSYKGANRKNNLKHHLNYACGINPQFQCTVCQKQFRKNQSLKYHMITVHQTCIF